MIDMIIALQISRTVRRRVPPKKQRICTNHMSGPGRGWGGPDPWTPPGSYATVWVDTLVFTLAMRYLKLMLDLFVRRYLQSNGND